MLPRSGMLLFGILLFTSAAAGGIRDIDFKEFSYPWTDTEKQSPQAVPRSSGDEWGWIGKPSLSEVRLENGRHSFTEPGIPPESAPYVMLQSVTYGDLNGDGQDEAAVVLHYGTGGTMTWNYLYVYTLTQSSPKLLDILVGGSRADGGLVKVVIENGLRVLDFNDSAKRIGDCCSEGFVRVRYRWEGNRFVETGDRYYADYENSPRTDRFGFPRSPEIKSSADVRHYEAALEANPEDLEARTLLLRWYFGHLNDAATGSVRLRHVLWTIEHHPDIPLTDFIDSHLYASSWLEPAVLLIDERSRDSFGRARQDWLDQVKRQPANMVVLYRAAIALSRSDPKLAAEWLKQVIRADSGPRGSTARQLLGRLNADAVMGVVARTPLQNPGPVDPAAAKSDIAHTAREEVEHSTDALMVGEAGSWLHETSRNLGLSRSGYDPLALEWLKLSWEWLKRAETLDNTEELVEMYESELIRDFRGLPPQPTRIKVAASEAPQPSSTVKADCPSGVSVLPNRGNVDVRLIIATDGRVRFALRRQGTLPQDPLLKPALESARQYRFPPTYRNGTAVEVETAITVAVCK